MNVCYVILFLLLALRLTCVSFADKRVMSMMVCTNTRDKFYLESPWKCEKCGYTMGYRDYFHFVNSKRLELHVIENDSNEIREFIRNNMWPKGLLHRTHEFIFRANLLIRDLEKGQFKFWCLSSV